ncbi:cellulose synthase/poly-beta-1,6-N-acetylglucosamine synthase-like glycosyltransferase [Nocardioides marinisabuli]|uniref:Cellulose synthase/poly-beta-1,6-N-acetylglucosamine synthase-like glycosyltransferase n=1 Tax=Nocardioides marinisabuli TaxID=419476 RepID=A0A7Y9EY54_9ACTN|nr:glycosyltransferase family 2 protein [Nocardioides marinisabuli]NYD56029.1 cellulose synthase/poly-beta-1,6-N-acetylglucosamine synthase-like glycosyltransferase [Nocardioides marinisabuli]
MSDDLRADQRLENGLGTAHGFVQRPDPGLEAYAEDFLGDLDAIPTVRATVGCIIPAYNEAETIAGVLDSLLQQTRLPDVVHLIVNNTSDDSVEIASHYAGPHTRMTPTGEQSTVVYVHDIGKNPDKKVGALNYGYSLVEHMDFLLGVDGDTTPEPDAIQHLVDEISSDDRIGGISAIYSIDDSALDGVMSKFLIAGQRAQFSAFNMQNLLKGRNMAVLGGQFSIFSTQALRDVMRDSHQRTPWVSDSEVEDSLLSLQIKSAGYLTKISARARAHVGGMTTLRSLDAQQVKWNFGAIDLMWPGQRGDTKGQPFHPNLRLRWFEHMSMVINMTTRFLFVVLLMWSLQLDAFVFSPLWLIPPLAAVWLNFRVAHSMQFRNRRDYLFVLLVFPAELYMMTRMGHFVRAWLKFFSKQQTDNWAAQAKAERGKGVAWTYPFIVVGLLLVGLYAGWAYGPLDPATKSDVLAAGWPVLGVITVLQTAWMLIKASKRYRGFKA